MLFTIINSSTLHADFIFSLTLGCGGISDPNKGGHGKSLVSSFVQDSDFAKRRLFAPASDLSAAYLVVAPSLRLELVTRDRGFNFKKPHYFFFERETTREDASNGDTHSCVAQWKARICASPMSSNSSACVRPKPPFLIRHLLYNQNCPISFT